RLLRMAPRGHDRYQQRYPAVALARVELGEESGNHLHIVAEGPAADSHDGTAALNPRKVTQFRRMEADSRTGRRLMTTLRCCSSRREPQQTPECQSLYALSKSRDSAASVAMCPTCDVHVHGAQREDF